MQHPFTLRHVAHLAGVLALFVIVLATPANAAAASRPVRVLCLDATGKEQMSLGPLHDAMGDLGRDAIWFNRLRILKTTLKN